ncbi:hypothetical protein [Yersinia rohdei]|uniref:hypothetical protein n=1 Tax=Yersinia rohdei TaxID=29485 RepID=UPI0011A2EE9B|nr:hypothetical protein [Yersinia rohdei]
MHIGNSHRSLNSTLEDNDENCSLLNTPSNRNHLPLGHSIDESDFEVLASLKCEGQKVIDNYTLPIIANLNDDDIKLPDSATNMKELMVILSKEVNRNGKPPLFLRPLGAILAFFGVHGFFQTNCVSCATSVIDSLADSVLYRAVPELRGANVAGNMTELRQSGKSATEVIKYLSKLNENDNLIGLLAIHRQPSWWRTLLSSTEGHACNVIKLTGSNTVHFLDTQKKTYFSYDRDKITESNHEIKKFLGSIGPRGIDLWTGRAKN